MATKVIQDLDGGYIQLTDADQTAQRVFQDLDGGYVQAPAAAAGGNAVPLLMQYYS